MIVATTRSQVADFVVALVNVYSVIIILYILMQLYFSFGGRVSYARWSSALLGFVRDVSEPYLRIFRRIIPPFGPLDLSPMIGLLVLYFVGGLAASAIRG